MNSTIQKQSSISNYFISHFDVAQHLTGENSFIFFQETLRGLKYGNATRYATECVKYAVNTACPF
jgi:hypothetical protein